MLTIPEALVITPKTCREHPKLGPVYTALRELFDRNKQLVRLPVTVVVVSLLTECVRVDTQLLAVFLMHEKLLVALHCRAT
jgi:hypothetical protein